MLLAAVVALSIFFRLGIIEALLRFYYEREEERGARSCSRSCAARSASCSIAITAGALLVAAFAGPLSEALLDRRDTELMLIAAGGLWVFTLYELMMALFRLDERARAYFTASFANVLLTIALTVWLVVGEDEGARGLLLGNFGGSAVILAGLFWVHRRRVALRPVGAHGAADAALRPADDAGRAVAVRAQRDRPRGAGARSRGWRRPASTRWP